MKARDALIGALLALACWSPGAQQLKVNPSTGETQKQFAKRTKWWRGAKFGMFIHWGVHAVPAYGEWDMNALRMQVKHCKKFAPMFNLT